MKSLLFRSARASSITKCFLQCLCSLLWWSGLPVILRVWQQAQGSGKPAYSPLLWDIPLLKMGLPVGVSGKEPACQCRFDLIPGLGRSPGAGHSKHSSALAWKIPWTEELGGPQSIGLWRVRHDWSILAWRHDLKTHVFITICQLLKWEDQDSSFHNISITRRNSDP